MKDFMREELARGPLTKENAMPALAAWGGRCEMGGINGAQIGQLMLAAAVGHVVSISKDHDECAAVWNALMQDTVRLLRTQMATKFESEGTA
ncbi:hypothetical protein [Sandarakinorhabdus sp.]|uniref:hypothetical protein n=1 Tax=Sandarakinorhabdus sp. TaxID=1916663 RepID=UPI00286E7F93|nr:hypothetical protein [Sandarakinorhabdus sp.]